MLIKFISIVHDQQVLDIHCLNRSKKEYTKCLNFVTIYHQILVLKSPYIGTLYSLYIL